MGTPWWAVPAGTTGDPLEAGSVRYQNCPGRPNVPPFLVNVKSDDSPARLDCAGAAGGDREAVPLLLLLLPLLLHHAAAAGSGNCKLKLSYIKLNQSIQGEPCFISLIDKVEELWSNKV